MWERKHSAYRDQKIPRQASSKLDLCLDSDLSAAHARKGFDGQSLEEMPVKSKGRGSRNRWESVQTKFQV